MGTKPQSIFELHPLPWKNQNGSALVDGNNNYIPFREEILELIAHAVNSHEELVGAIEVCVKLATININHPDTIAEVEMVYAKEKYFEKIKSALARAKGE